MNEPIHESDAGGGRRGECAGCERLLAGQPCDATCEVVEVSAKDLAYILGRSRSWVSKAEKQGLFKRTNESARGSYLLRTVREGLLRYYGAHARKTLSGAHIRFHEIISGGTARNGKKVNRAKGSKKGKRRG